MLSDNQTSWEVVSWMQTDSKSKQTKWANDLVSQVYIFGENMNNLSICRSLHSVPKAGMWGNAVGLPILLFKWTWRNQVWYLYLHINGTILFFMKITSFYPKNLMLWEFSIPLWWTCYVIQIQSRKRKDHKHNFEFHLRKRVLW